jgi:hypothetical protein
LRDRSQPSAARRLAVAVSATRSCCRLRQSNRQGLRTWGAVS